MRITKEEKVKSIAYLLNNLLTDRPQSRALLCAKIGVNDRDLREAKSYLVSQGVPVCSNSGTNGYYLGGKEEIEHTIAEMRSRAKSLNEQANALEASIAPVSGQLSWEVM